MNMTINQWRIEKQLDPWNLGYVRGYRDGGEETLYGPKIDHTTRSNPNYINTTINHIIWQCRRTSIGPSEGVVFTNVKKRLISFWAVSGKLLELIMSCNVTGIRSIIHLKKPLA